MARVRWYHFYFALALFDIVVILTSLQLQRHTVERVQGLLDRFNHLDDESKSLQRMQQGILDVNEPGNELFHTNDLALEKRRFDNARIKLTAALADAAANGINTAAIRPNINKMISAAQEVFDHFATMGEAGQDVEQRRSALAAAGQAMSRMDAETQAALRRLALLTASNMSLRSEFLQEHERDVQQQWIYDSYFVAAIVLILAGMLYFGRRLQAADRMLEFERRRAEEERRERLAQIGELCSSVAHGIRNPLAAMRSSAQLTLELGKIDEGSRERVRDILTEGQRLADRVTRLLDFAQARIDLFGEVDLRELVIESIGEIEPELHRRQIRVDREMPAGIVPIEGDRHQLQQVVIELLSNAMDQSKAGDVIHVACRSGNGDGMASVSVEDSGPGVRPEVQARIFDLFFSTKPSGTGIGLATVQRIARLHGGDVTLAESQSGRGARFVVTLPRNVRSSWVRDTQPRA